MSGIRYCLFIAYITYGKQTGYVVAPFTNHNLYVSKITQLGEKELIMLFIKSFNIMFYRSNKIYKIKQYDTICNICNIQIIGDIYKCDICENSYILCKECCHENKHDHNVYQIIDEENNPPICIYDNDQIKSEIINQYYGAKCLNLFPALKNTKLKQELLTELLYFVNKNITSE